MMVFHHFLVQLYILIKFWPEKIIFVFFCEFESSGNSVMHCKGGTLPQKRLISKDVWNSFLLWFWMRFGDHRALYHVPIVIIPTLVYYLVFLMVSKLQKMPFTFQFILKQSLIKGTCIKKTEDRNTTIIHTVWFQNGGKSWLNLLKNHAKKIKTKSKELWKDQTSLIRLFFNY